MFLSRTFFLVLILGIIVSPLSAGEGEDLKATFDKALEYLNQKDLDAFLSVWHSKAVLFSRNQIHPIDRAKPICLKSFSPKSLVLAIHNRQSKCV